MHNNKAIIPIMLCHDNNYVIPSAVAIYSLLANADKNYIYKFFLLHTDITNENQIKLKNQINKFPNALIEFVDMKNKFEDIFRYITNKAHYSKEMFYKLIITSMFPQYDKIIITDVDVVFLRDISKSFIDFNIDDDIHLAGIQPVDKINSFLEMYKKSFNEKEINIIKNGIGAGYLIFNLKKMRAEKIEEKYIQFLKENFNRLIQPEQDVINFCSKSKIKFLPLEYMTCSYMYDLYDEQTLMDEHNFTKEELKKALQSPIQLHYATHIKPWNNLSCLKSEIWLEYLLKTDFAREYLEKFHKPKESKTVRKKIFHIVFNYKKNKKYKLTFEKIKEL